MSNIETFVTNAYQSTITAELSAVGTSFPIADPTGLVVPFYIVIEPDNASQREYALIDQLVGNVATIDSRYLAGSAAASGLVHPPGSVIRMSIMSQHLIDINDRADDLQAQVIALGDHGGLTGLADDDHPQYYNAARHTTSLHNLMGIDHGMLGGVGDDDHAQYYNATRHTKAIHDALAIDHGSLTGNADDDHTQYYNAARHTKAIHDALAIDHGSLSGRTDDDHTQYVLATGTRPITGPFSIGGHLTPGTDLLHDLGSDTLSWRRLYAQAIYDENGVGIIDTDIRTLLDAWIVGGHFTPSANGTFDLGGISARFREAYVNVVNVGGGTAADPVYATAEGSGLGIYFPSSINMQFSVGGVARIGITSTQFQAPVIHDATTGSAANVVVASTGSNQMLRSTSALRYKESVTPAFDLADVQLMPTKHYRPDDKRWRYGLIADWLADQDPLLGVFGEGGQIENYDDRAVLAVIAAKLMRLEEALLYPLERVAA